MHNADSEANSGGTESSQNTTFNAARKPGIHYFHSISAISLLKPRKLQEHRHTLYCTCLEAVSIYTLHVPIRSHAHPDFIPDLEMQFAAAAAHSSIQIAASDGMESILQKLGMAAHTDAFLKVQGTELKQIQRTQRIVSIMSTAKSQTAMRAI